MLANAFVYILANSHNTTLYVGVTADLPTRVWEHKTRQNPKCFTARYNVNKLVHYEGFTTIVDAIAREKQLKGKSRAFKEALVRSINPEWKELIVTG